MPTPGKEQNKKERRETGKTVSLKDQTTATSHLRLSIKTSPCSFPVFQPVSSYNPPCFSKKNATAVAGAEDFPPSSSFLSFLKYIRLFSDIVTVILQL